MGLGHVLDCSMSLFLNIIEILDLAHHHRGAVLGILTLDRGFMGRTAVEGDLRRHALAADRLRSEAFRRLLVAFLSEEQVHRLAGCIHGARARAPQAFHLHRRFVHAPVRPPRARAPMTRRFQPRALFDAPAAERGVIHGHGALFPQCFDMARAQGVGAIPPHSHQNDLGGQCAL